MSEPGGRLPEGQAWGTMVDGERENGNGCWWAGGGIPRFPPGKDPPRLYTHPPGHCPCACCAAVAELALHVTSFLSFFSFSKKSLLQRLHLEAEWCKPVVFANRAWFRLAGAGFSRGVGRWLWLCRPCLVKNPWLCVNVYVYACVRT